MYKQGETIERYGSFYLVERVYEVSDKDMKEQELYHKKRVTLRKLRGENGMDREDFAISDQER